MKSEPLNHQVAIITGASAGIGKALALQLSGQGAKVVLAARRADLLEQVAAECRKRGGDALAVPTDVQDEAQCRALVMKAIQNFGRLDLLINNAGMAATALLEEFPDLHLFRHTMEVNFYGAVYCTYYALPYLKQSHGRIVAISSIGGKTAMPYNTPYISSKFAMHGFFDSLRMELRSSGVSVTIICPSWVRTEFHEVQMDKDGVSKGASGRAIYSERTMTSERCAEITLKAASRRQREVLMGPAGVTVWLKLLSPGLVDWLTVDVFLGAIKRRAKANSRPDGQAELPAVTKTLLAPLACRAKEAARSDAILSDPIAVQVSSLVKDCNLSVKGISEHDRFAIVMRARQYDRYARAFLESHSEGLVVDINCGLSTRFHRLDNGRMSWLGIDRPEAIDLRRQFLPDGERNCTLAGPMLAPSWLDEIAHLAKPTIILAEDVFPYFKESQIKDLIQELRKRIPGAEIVFDLLSPASVRMYNNSRAVQDGTKPRLNWAVDDARSLESWGLVLLEEWGYFDQREPRMGFGGLFGLIPAFARANRIAHFRLKD